MLSAACAGKPGHAGGGMYLDLDVPRALNEALQQHALIAKGRCGLALRRR